MRRFVSMLLIPTFALGQALPHSHAGTGVIEPDDHALRPHIHLGLDFHDEDACEECHHHHAHDVCGSDESDVEKVAHLSTPIDHDSDAIYFAESDWAASRTVTSPQVDLLASYWTSAGPSVVFDAGVRLPTIDAPDPHTGLPVYLLTASLRL